MKIGVRRFFVLLLFCVSLVGYLPRVLPARAEGYLYILDWTAGRWDLPWEFVDSPPLTNGQSMTSTDLFSPYKSGGDCAEGALINFDVTMPYGSLTWRLTNVHIEIYAERSNGNNVQASWYGFRSDGTLAGSGVTLTRTGNAWVDMDFTVPDDGGSVNLSKIRIQSGSCWSGYIQIHIRKVNFVFDVVHTPTPSPTSTVPPTRTPTPLLNGYGGGAGPLPVCPPTVTPGPSPTQPFQVRTVPVPTVPVGVISPSTIVPRLPTTPDLRPTATCPPDNLYCYDLLPNPATQTAVALTPFPWSVHTATAWAPSVTPNYTSTPTITLTPTPFPCVNSNGFKEYHDPIVDVSLWSVSDYERCFTVMPLWDFQVGPLTIPFVGTLPSRQIHIPEAQICFSYVDMEVKIMGLKVSDVVGLFVGVFCLSLFLGPLFNQ